MNITPFNFNDFTISKISHYKIFHELKCDQDLYGKELYGNEDSSLKSYQHCLVLSFIRSFIPVGSRILDVGGGTSRISNLLQNEYECWIIDKFEGCGNGPITTPKGNFKIVKDYIGNFNTELPDYYFDLVFSVSVLEHVPEDENVWKRIRDDIRRVMIRNGYSIHCIDVTLRNGWVCSNGILWNIFKEEKTFNQKKSGGFKEIDNENDLFTLQRSDYDKNWKHLVGGKTYEEWGKTFSYNVLW